MELTRRGIEAFQRGDVSFIQELMTPDVVLIEPPEVPGSRTFVGPAGVREAIEAWPTEWEDFRLDLVEVIDVSDDAIISVTHQQGRGRTSGIEAEFEVLFVSHLRNGKTARLEMFFTRKQALEAVGLED